MEEEPKYDIMNNSIKSPTTKRSDKDSKMNVSNDDELEKAEDEINQNLFWCKAVVVVFIVLCLVISAVYFDEMKTLFVSFIEYLKNHIILGSLILIGIKVIGTILYVPGVLLAIGVGFAYKQIFSSYLISIPISVLIYFIGSCIGCTCAFFLGKTILKSCLRPRFIKYRYFRALDKAIMKHGKKVNFLLRCTPLIPYNIINYLLGVTNTKYIDYLFGLIGFIPLVTLYCFMGSTLENLSNFKSENQTLETIIFAASVVISVVCIFFITKVAKKHLDEELHNIAKEENDRKV